jgi:phospholipid-binding lipoprotein MlaA
MKKNLFLLITVLLIAAVVSVGCSHCPNKAGTSTSAGDIDLEMNAGGSDGLEGFDGEFQSETMHVEDPLIALNRVMYHVNDRLYYYVLKPMAEGYDAVVPELFRSGVRNFFQNLTMPVRLVNCILQGKLDAAGSEIARFCLNSTVGVLGFGNPARNYPGMDLSNEDMGQTLATYGISNGFYIFWPVFGPSTLRDSLGRLGDWPLSPLNHVESGEVSIGLNVLSRVNSTSFQLGEYEAIKEAAFEPYIAIRDGYIAIRKKMIDN